MKEYTVTVPVKITVSALCKSDAEGMAIEIFEKLFGSVYDVDFDAYWDVEELK